MSTLLLLFGMACGHIPGEGYHSAATAQNLAGLVRVGMTLTQVSKVLGETPVVLPGDNWDLAWYGRARVWVWFDPPNGVVIKVQPAPRRIRVVHGLAEAGVW
jgi:hypothetical protein